MSQLHIEDIRISYEGQDLSQYGLFPLVAWYLMDVLKLPEYFEQVTVNQTRNPNRTRKPKEHLFTDAQICSLRSAVYFVNRHGIDKSPDSGS